ERVDFTASYDVTAGDVTTGSVANTAVASGTTPGGDPIDSPPTSVTVDTARPSLTMVKSAEFDDADDDGLLSLGEEITYAFVVTNDGNVAIQGVTIDDPRVSGITPTSADIPAGGQQV